MNQHATITSSIKLKAYSIGELAVLYERSEKVIRTWLAPMEQEIGPRRGHCYTPRQIKIIFTELGIPGIMLQN